MNYYIINANIVNESKVFKGNILISNEKIAKIVIKDEDFKPENAQIIDANGKYLIPGIIDEHVHFRDPGLTSKADIYTESKAAVAGGITSFMDMPNTMPQTTSQSLVNEKIHLAQDKSLANFAFYLGATNDNLKEIENINRETVCGIKLFMGSSTGNMLVDNDASLKTLFENAPCIIAAHCEDENIIQHNTSVYKKMADEGKISADASIHPLIRSAEACYKSSAKAVELADKTNARLHIMHISTEQELSLFRNDIPLKEKKITAETCPHYLTFTDEDYEKFGFAIKCNPAIKSGIDRQAILKALNNNIIDTIGTDHAPHLKNEKFTGNYFTSKSGFPSIQHSLNLMLKIENLGLPKIVELMCHNPAILYRIKDRGFIREGYFADLVLVDLNCENIITDDSVYYKCGWTPYNGIKINSKITHTFVNGNLVYENGNFNEESRGRLLSYYG